MSAESDARIAAAAARARAAMAAGATLDDVLRTFRTGDGLSALESMDALQEIAAMDLSFAKLIVSNSCAGRSYAQLTLADLELLGDARGLDYVTRYFHLEAIIERKPFLLYERDPSSTSDMYRYLSATPLETPPAHRTICDSMTGSFDRVCASAHMDATALPTELRILRDEPDQMLLHFLRVSSASVDRSAKSH